MKCYKCLQMINGENKYGLHLTCFLDWFDLADDKNFRDLELKSEFQPISENRKITNFRGWNSSFFHGNYKKYSASLGKDFYILKVKEDKYPHLPSVEYTCNQIAHYLKLPVAKFFLLSLNGEEVFVTKNFCRSKSTTMNLDHIYKYLSKKNSFDCETLIKIISEQTKKYLDIATFIQTCLFDTLIGNHDRHGRNLGFLVTNKSSRLAPIYDNPSQLGLESGAFLKMHWSPKGKIYTNQSTAPTPKDYIVEFIKLGYADLVFAFIDRLKTEKLFQIINEGFYPLPMKTALKQLIQSRLKEFYDNDPRH